MISKVEKLKDTVKSKTMDLENKIILENKINEYRNEIVEDAKCMLEPYIEALKLLYLISDDYNISITGLKQDIKFFKDELESMRIRDDYGFK